MKLNVQTCKDWDLIVALCHWGYKPFLTAKQKNDAYKKVWAKSDGYGEEGYIPSQGYDWSGIRDSSEEATVKMADAARIYLLNQGIEELEYEKESFNKFVTLEVDK
ncbi:hypothetical protein C4577_06615 [Candidatus Parcubacteria bacterium]|nr:MAG: hypothetical protein C4577_06615 [Candidatus Parcubacteria bacterium]